MTALPYVGLDPATSVGLGHLVRVACLRSILRPPSRILGRYDAWIDTAGLAARRRLFRLRAADPAVWVVDSGHLSQAVIRRRLERREAAPVIWIRRGLFKPQQAAIQAGYIGFVDLILAPEEAVPQARDAVDDIARRKGKLVRVDVSHAYQALPATEIEAEPRVFLALGAYTPRHRAAFIQLKRQLDARGIRYLWSAHGFEPVLAGFPPGRRIPVRRALAAKAACSGFASEAGYNSVYEALHLGRPVLLFANETEGREAQQARVDLARALSPNVFDAGRAADVEAWLAVAGDPAHSRHVPAAVAESRGLQQMAAQIERVFDVATSRPH